MKQAPSRNSAVELLRILAMGMIVLSHCCLHGGYDRTYPILTANRLFVQFGILGNLGTALFVMISGYFLCQKAPRRQTFTRLLSQVWFYSIALFLLCRFGLGVEFSSLLPVLFPTVYGEYWFFTAYFVLLLLVPGLNIMASSLTRQQLRTLLWALTCVWVLIPTLTKQQLYGGELPQFLYFYLLGACFRLYPDNVFQKPCLRWSAAVGGFALLYALTLALGYAERFTSEAFGAANRFYDRNSVFTVAIAVGLFSIAVNARPFVNKHINTISGCTFGVYLLHDHPAIRKWLWQGILNWNDYFTSGSFIPRLCLSVVLVYAVCTAIEWLRQKTIAQPTARLLDSLLEKLPGKNRIH